MPDPVRIGIAFQPSRHWLRTALRGITRFAQGQPETWELIPLWYERQFAETGGEASYWDEVNVDGIVQAIDRQNEVRARAVPKVYLGMPREAAIRAGHSFVVSDHRRMGRQAAEELMLRGFRSLGGFLSADEDLPLTKTNWAGFTEACTEQGITPNLFTNGPRTERRGHWLLQDQMLDLTDWLQTQTLPLGLFALPPDHAWRALVACQEAGLRVPDDVAIIAGADDDAMLPWTKPSLSAVCEDTERVGYEAARLLAQAMQGDTKLRQVMVPPLGVLPRESTDVRAIDDPELSRVVDYIWSNVGRALRVNDLLEAFPIARSSLLVMFKKHLGRSPSDEIKRSRVETAKRLLINTDRSLTRIALDAGLGSPSQLSRTLKEATGQSPTGFRKQFRIE